MVLCRWQHDIRMSILWDMFFKNNINIYITFIWCINQLSPLNTSSFLFPQMFFSFIIIQLQLTNFIITYQLGFALFQALNLLKDSIFCPSFYLFPVIFWMLWMLVVKYKAKFTLWKTLERDCLKKFMDYLGMG